MPMSAGAGIHWQVAQATSLQNIVFNMIQGGGEENKQLGIFMDNGSGGFMSDLIFNGGAFGAFFGNQQFTSRNLTFNQCQTAIFMNWNWLWTLKSIYINDCDIGIDMSELTNSVNQTVGSVILLDSVICNTPIGVKTSYNSTSLPNTGGTLILQNVDFTTVQIAVAAGDDSEILAGGSVIQSWAQGNTYQPQYGAGKFKREPQVPYYPSYSSITTQVAAGPPYTSTAWVVPLPLSTGTSPNNPTSTSTSFPTNWTPTTTPSNSMAAALPVVSSRIQQQLTPPSIPTALMSGNRIFERSKPQYEDLPVSCFVSVKSCGAIGDGVTDDTIAIQTIFNQTTPDMVVYFDHGAYVITDTVIVPPNIRITGEIWPLIMADGACFNDVNNPKPVFQVGQPGDIGNVEISDLIFETLGPAPGAIMMEWNVQGETQGSAGLWDVHFRIGGTAGTQLQQDTCLANVTGSFQFNPECAGSFLMLHITQEASAYVENSWLWVADHDLDSSNHSQIDIFNGRGMLVESAGPTWLYGTSVEHSQLYNYQVNNAQNLFMGAIQTETAYMQSAPNALEGGFTPNPDWADPDFSSCTDDFCRKTWGLRIQNSQDIYMYGGGLYSFFDNYIQTCLDTESCQTNMVDIECSNAVYLYGLSTKASTNMVVVDGDPQAFQQDNTNGFCQTIALFEEQTNPDTTY
jgi:glucan 1,3-beta-glucosidase